MKKVLITRRIPEIAEEILSKHFTVEARGVNEPLPPALLREAVKSYYAILSTITDRFDEPLLSSGGALRVISNYAAGLNNIDTIAAKRFGIAVYNTPDIVTRSTADMTVGLLLAHTRKIREAADFVKAGGWKGWDPEIFLGEELADMTVGIIGFGRIGQAVAKRLLPFGPRIIFYDSRPDVATDAALHDTTQSVSFDVLLAESDIITIHADLNETTRNMINAGAIGKMVRHPYLLNLSRGEIVDPGALLTALRSGGIRGAMLDVTSPEPLPSDHPLLSMPNCIVTPHIGTATFVCRREMARIAAQNIVNHFLLNK